MIPIELVETIRSFSAPIVISHVVPDADALGSMFTCARALSSPHCRPMVSLPAGSLSQRLAFLHDMASVMIAKPEDFAVADGFLVLDTAKKPRCNIYHELKVTEWVNAKPLVNIDHHETNTRFGSVNWVVPSAGSSCELVYQLLRHGNWSIDAVSASLLYAGILTDTLGFSLGTTTPTALEACGDLVRLGADIENLGERLYRSQSKNEFDLLRVIYDNTRTLASGRIAYSSASFEEIHGAGCTAAEIDEQINVPRSLQGVQLAMLFSEGKREKTRINFRGSGNVTVVELAAEFKGGGHAQAAGAILDCGLSAALDRVLPRAIDHLKNFPA